MTAWLVSGKHGADLCSVCLDINCVSTLWWECGSDYVDGDGWVADGYEAEHGPGGDGP